MKTRRRRHAGATVATLLCVASLVTGIGGGLAHADAADAEAENTFPVVRVVRTGGVRADAAALLFGAADGGGLRTAVAAYPRGTMVRGRHEVEVVVEIAAADILAVAQPEATLLGDGSRRRIQTVDIAMYSLDDSSALLASVSSSLDLDLDQIELGPDGGLRWRSLVSLPGGEHRVRTLVRLRGATDDGSDVSLRTVRLSLPASGPAVGPPRFPESRLQGTWIAVEAPLPQGATAWMRDSPSARPVVRLEQAHHVDFDLPGSSPPVDGWVMEAWRPEEFERRVRWPLELNPSAAATPGARSWTVHPSQLAAGPAMVRVAHPSDTNLASPPIEVWIASAAQESGTGWVVAMEAGPEGSNVASSASASRTGARSTRLSRGRAAAVRRDLTSLLADWSAGRESAAQSALSNLLARELGATRPADPQDLAEVFFELLRDLGAEARPSWLAVIALHDHTYRAAVARRDYLVSSFARRFALTLVEGLIADEPSTHPVVAAYLTSLAGRALQDHGAWEMARPLLERALSLDPNKESARLLLATEFARRGQVDAAAAVLQPLIESAGPSAEVRLRHALARQRATPGERTRVERTLVELTSYAGAATEPWVVQLASQELRRAAIQASRHGLSIEEVAADGAGGPVDEKQALLIAWNHQRAGRSADASAVTATVAPTPPGVTGARRRFGEAPHALLRADAELFTAGVRAQSARLAAALQRSGK